MKFLRVNIGEYFKIRRLLSMSQTGHRSQLAIMESIDTYMALLLRCYIYQRYSEEEMARWKMLKDICNT